MKIGYGLLSKNDIIKKLKELKPHYAKEGLTIVGLFGSYARCEESKFSDIDIAYHINYDEFSKKQIGGFAKLLKLDEIKDELQSIFKTKVDLVSDSNKSILKDIVYV